MTKKSRRKKGQHWHVVKKQPREPRSRETPKPGRILPDLRAGKTEGASS